MKISIRWDLIYVLGRSHEQEALFVTSLTFSNQFNQEEIIIVCCTENIYFAVCL